MARTVVSDQIRDFLVERLEGVDEEIELEDDHNIFELGHVDSLFAIEMVNFVEHSFGVRVENDDLRLANFESVASLSAFVASKLADEGEV